MKCPAELYTASARHYAGLPELTYPLHDRDVVITSCGRLCLHRKKINISVVLAGQKLGIKEVDEGIWLVSFMHYDLGYFDVEQKTLQPLDNPFGTSVTHVLGTFGTSWTSISTGITAMMIPSGQWKAPHRAKEGRA